MIQLTILTDILKLHVEFKSVMQVITQKQRHSDDIIMHTENKDIDSKSCHRKAGRKVSWKRDKRYHYSLSPKSAGGRVNER